MFLLKCIRYISIAILIIGLTSCANPELEYSEIRKLQESTEEILKNTPDFDVRIKSCENMINTLKKFLSKHKKGEWNSIANNAFSSWVARKVDIEKEKQTLLDSIYKKLADRAVESAFKVHPMSDIENIKLLIRLEDKEGSDILVKDTYTVRMRGAIAGQHIFKLKLTVSGKIDMKTKTIRITDNPIVIE